MSVDRIDPEKVKVFDRLYLDYIKGASALDEFYPHKADLASLIEQAKDRHFAASHRETLVEVLTDQYKGYPATQKVMEQIAKLSQSNTVTVTTGHQLNLCGGPLYFIYKILTTIRLAEELNAAQEDHSVVPVFWMATEDHDWEEVNHFHLFGKTYHADAWQGGPVGHQLTHLIAEVLKTVPELPEFMLEAYSSSKTLAEATRKWVHHLFGGHGLVIIDADNTELKRLFIPHMRAELDGQATRKGVSVASKKLEEKGYKTQAHARDLNLFYLTLHGRDRIIEAGEQFEVLNKDISYSHDGLMKELEEHPVKFSPNVFMRPLYQETILPNIAYIGGPAEVLYWLQLKPVFDKMEVSYPVLVPRQNMLYLTKADQRKIEKMKISNEELFLEFSELKSKLVFSEGNDKFQLTQEEEELKKIFHKIKGLAEEADHSLEAYTAAEEKKVLKLLDEVRKKIRKAMERKAELELSQLKSVNERVFPNGKTLQERHDNFLQYYIPDHTWIDTMRKAINPLDFRFTIVKE